MKTEKLPFSKLLERLDLPEYAVSGSSQVIINGRKEVSVDMISGLLAYSEEEITVAVSGGIIAVQGDKLQIKLLREGRIVIRGEISAVHCPEGIHE